MLEFLDYLQIEGEVPAAAMSWIDSLERKRGIHLKPTAITRLFNFGETQQIVTTTIAPGYNNPNELIKTIRRENCQMNCNPILNQQKIYGNKFPGRHIDHDKSLFNLKKSGIIKITHSLGEALQYIEYMKSQGVYFGEGKWEEVLPTEHQKLLRSIEDEIELYASTGRLIAKCNPSPQTNHPEKALYRLGGQWNGDKILGKRIEEYHTQGKFFFTHTFCNDCFERQMMEIENI